MCHSDSPIGKNHLNTVKWILLEVSKVGHVPAHWVQDLFTKNGVRTMPTAILIQICIYLKKCSVSASLVALNSCICATNNEKQFITCIGWHQY